ncbi:MAG: tryptophan synthase subunit beta [Proteobacteria bacterium]|jgi:tryptophan synthase beta chain|nr:tryptophan synthase subunit beta [Pseudomonadota bacterium]
MKYHIDLKGLNQDMPDERGRFGIFGGQYVPETLMPAINRLTQGVKEILPSKNFLEAWSYELNTWVGRPTALTFAHGLSEKWNGKIWLKREDLAHTGAHKINNAIGQALLAKELGVKRIVAETGAGQHGVATAAACARVGMPCTVYMGELDVARQSPNVDRMLKLGAKVVPVTSGDKTLRAAIDEAMRHWVTDPENTYYLLGSAVGPHPYPLLVRELQSVIGKEAKQQMKDLDVFPDAVFACVGGGSNAIGLFHDFIDDKHVELHGIEAGGRGQKLGEHSAPMSLGKPGVLHGSYSMLLYNDDGQIQETHSVSAGLDYPGVGPEHSYLAQSGRAKYSFISDNDAFDTLEECSEVEGILPALETAHAFAGAKKWLAENGGKTVLIGLSGRGDKDMPIISTFKKS